MAQQESTHRPDLCGEGLTTGNWTDDHQQGVDYELIFDRLQYCFIEISRKPLVLDFMAHSHLDEDHVRNHPELHTNMVPTEVADWLVGRTYAHIEDNVDACRRFTITGIVQTPDREDDDVRDHVHEPTVFETEGDTTPRERLTAAEAVRSLAVRTIQPVDGWAGESHR